ncbi:MAG: hypothetical protein F6K26_10970 [Moorea sp. SIO2I5]|nr:hypothetical protein [Moorena sp. SIO2I5]
MSEDAPKRIAFVISALTGDELRAVNRDVSRVYTMLTNPELGMCNHKIPPFYECKNPHEFENRFFPLFDNWRIKDQLIFYFSGHGDILQDQYCLKLGTTRQDFYPFKNLITNLRIKNVNRAILIIDACHSGAAVEGIKESQGIFSTINQEKIPKGIAIIASSRKSQTSRELKDGSHGVFTKLLCDGIETGLENKPTHNGLISVVNIVDYIEEKLTTDSNYCEFSQRPVFKVNAEQDIWIAKNKSEDVPKPNQTSGNDSVITPEEQRSIFIYIENYHSEKPIVLTADSDKTPTIEDIPCPYLGLSHFSPNDAEFFFGREAFVEELVKAAQTRNFIPVLGSSGSGKSSVVLAGLVPKLEKAGNWQFTHFRPSNGNDPFYALAEALVPLYMSELDSTDEMTQARKLAKFFRGDEGELSLAEVSSKIQRKHPNHKVLLIADQFEELYTQYSDSELHHRFLDCLLASLSSSSQSSSSMVLVAMMRADFLENALSYRPFADVLQNADLKLGPMNHKELTEVIVKPIEKLNEKLNEKVTFQADLVKRILDDVEDEPGKLPLLEFALTELWNKREGKQLTHKAYREIGEVKGALSKHATTKYKSLTQAEQKKAEQIFIQLVQPGRGTKDTRRLVTKADLGNDKWSVVKKLADARLVVTSKNNNNIDVVEIAHEALIQNWELLQEWIRDNREFRIWQERLRAAISQWEDAKKDEGALLRGMPLGEAKKWLKERGKELSRSEQEYILHSAELSARLRQEEEQLQQRELELIRERLEEEKKARQAQSEALKASQIKTKFAIAASGATVIALGVIGYASWQQQKSEKTLETVFLKTEPIATLNALPDFHKKADKFKKALDQLKETEDLELKVNYYRDHKESFDKLFAYYRNIMTATGRLNEQVTETEKSDIEEISAQAEASLAELLNTYRISQLELDLNQPKPNFGKLLPKKRRRDFEKQYPPNSALRTTYEIIMRESGAGADLNNDGLMNDKQEAKQIPCKTLVKIEQLWRNATDQRCGWYGEWDGDKNFYNDQDCYELEPDKNDRSTLYSSIFDFTNREVIKRIEYCQKRCKKNVNKKNI